MPIIPHLPSKSDFYGTINCRSFPQFFYPTGGVPWKFHRLSIFICSITGPIPKKNTVKTCEFVLHRFTVQFGKRDLASISQEEVLTFLMSLTKDNKQATKRNRYSVLASFYNLSINTALPGLTNLKEMEHASPSWKKSWLLKNKVHRSPRKVPCRSMGKKRGRQNCLAVQDSPKPPKE